MWKRTTVTVNVEIKMARCLYAVGFILMILL